MDISRVKIGDPLSRVALSCNALTKTRTGQEITARVVISAEALHYLMVKATRNRSKRSHVGPLDVVLLDVKEVQGAVR